MSSPYDVFRPAYSYIKYEDEIYEARWQEALQQCRGDLDPPDMEAVLRFRHPMQLMGDFEVTKWRMTDGVMVRLVVFLCPALNALRYLSIPFLVTTRSITMALFWILFHIVIRTCMAFKASLARFVRMPSRLRRELDPLGEIAVAAEQQPELRHALVDFFVKVIGFWKETVRFNRQKTTEWLSEHLLISGLLGRKPKLDLALIRVEDAVERLNWIASLSKSRKDTVHAQNVNREILTMLPANGDDGIRFPVYTCPPCPTFFFGRQPELTAIREHLSVATPLDHLRTFVVYGIGGVGKTALALAFADQCRAERALDAIFWISSETPAEIRRSFSEIALHMGLPRADRDMDSESNMMLVRNWLSKTSKRWLCIYDNVEDVRALDRCLPPGNGRALFTTRYKHVSAQIIGNVWRLELDTFNKSESLQLFGGLWKSYDGQAFPERRLVAAEALISPFDGLVLGLEQAAAYIAQHGCTVAQYTARYAQEARSLVGKGDGSRSAHTLATAWNMHFESIAGTIASRLFGILSLISPDSIPIALLSLDGEEDPRGGFEFCTDPELLKEAIDDLMRVALIKRRGDHLSLHRLVQQAFLYSTYGLQDQQLAPHFAMAVHMVRRKFPTSGGSTPMWGRWETCAIYLPHAQALASVYTRFKLHRASLDCRFELVDLWKDCIWYLHEAGDHVEALKLTEVACGACEDKSSLQYAYLRSHAGCIHYAMNNMKAARECNMDGLRIREEKADLNDATDHLELANSYDNSGIERFSVGDYEESLRLSLKAQQIRESRDGGDAYKAMSNVHIGQIYAAMGRYLEAEETLDAAIKNCVEGGSSAEFFKAFIVLHRGNLDLKQGIFDKAEIRYQAALEVLKRDGPMHRFTSTCYYKLGMVAARRSNIQDALSYMDKSMLIAEYQQKSGAIARCLHQKARLMESLPHPTDQERADGVTWRLRASAIALRIGGKGNDQPAVDDQDEVAYDHLLNGEER